MQKYILSILLVLCGHAADAQIITTIAGDGSFVYSGDGIPATDAALITPHGIAVDPIGNVYISDGAQSVRKVDTSGIITTYAGTGSGTDSGDGGPATAAGISSLLGIALDTVGNLYLATTTCKIRMVNTMGIINTIAGTGVSGYSGDGGPASVAQFGPILDIATDKHGNIYLCDGVNHCVRKIDPSGIISTVAGTGVAGYNGDGIPATAAQLKGPRSICTDYLSNLYIADYFDYRVRKVNTAGIISTVAGTGTFGFSGDGGAATAALLGPNGLAVSGNYIYISDVGSQRVRMIDPSGIITTIAGNGTPGYSGDGGPATAASINYSNHLARYGGGNLYFCDRDNYRIRMVTMPNEVPYFVQGDTLSRNLCSESLQLDTMLQVMDRDTAQPITWQILLSPAHGSLTANYFMYASGDTLTPSLLSYVPYFGYVGSDTFSVCVWDGGGADTIVIAIDVQVFPVAAPITGDDTICVSNTVSYTVTTTGGIWSSHDATVDVDASTGFVTGVVAGTAIISYTVTNPCGSDITTRTITILPEAGCPTWENTLSQTDIRIFPNPGNSMFALQLPQGMHAAVSISDVTGRVVQQFAANTSATFSLDVPDGVYLVSVQTQHGVWNGRLVVH